MDTLTFTTPLQINENVLSLNYNSTHFNLDNNKLNLLNANPWVEESDKDISYNGTIKGKM